ncbi:hypothetical protein AB3N58_02745 [Leptospira sp. WS60.C2]
MIFRLSQVIVSFLLLVSLNCAAFPDRVTLKNRNLKLSNEQKLKILFTGFYRYETEKEMILQEIIKQGIEEDTSSKITLEIILQKKDPKYQYPLLHRVQFLLTFLSGGIFPSHIRTEQTLTFRYSQSDRIIKENEYSVGMDQWRGIPIVIFMISHWPNKIFKDQLSETTKLEFSE